MNTTNSIKLYELSCEFVKDKEKAKTFVEKIEALVDDKTEQRFEHLATKSDLNDLKLGLLEIIRSQRYDLVRSVYFVGLIQFLAIVGSAIAIISVMHP